MCFFQGMPPAALTDDEAFLEPSGSQSDRKTSLSISNLDILSVNQLLESVRQTFYGAPVFKFLFNHPIYVNPSILHFRALDDSERFIYFFKFSSSNNEFMLTLWFCSAINSLFYLQVLETARQVASFPVSSAPVPYDQMKSQCEALVSCKQQKMSVLHSFKHKNEEKAIVLSSEIETLYPPLPVNVSNIIKFWRAINSIFLLIFSELEGRISSSFLGSPERVSQGA